MREFIEVAVVIIVLVAALMIPLAIVVVFDWIFGEEDENGK